MVLNLHNKLEVFVDEKKYIFYNTMLASVFDALANFEAYNKYLAVGIGTYQDNEKTQKLSEFTKKYTLNHEILQNNLTSDVLFVKKSLVISDDEFCDNFITEVGLCCDSSDNPTIYNYITLVSEELPFGIKKAKGEKLVFNLYIYLDISNAGIGNFCLGENKLIGFLLGEGLNEKLYVQRGKNLSENVIVYRGYFEDENRVEAKFNFEKSDFLTLTFEADLGVGETDEIVFICGENVVARINVLNINEPVQLKLELLSKNNNILDIGEDACEILSVVNINSQESENSYQKISYARSFGEKISLPFSGLFDSETPRFVSSDGKYLFFIKNDLVYGYKNENYTLTSLVTKNVRVQHIKKIIALDDFVFVITGYDPYVYVYKIDTNNVLQKQLIDLNRFDYFSEFEHVYSVDVVMTKEGKFIIAAILDGGKGVSIYFGYSEENSALIYEDYLLSDYDFSYIVAINKNIYLDAQVMYLKGAEYSYDCRIVTHYADKTVRDVATVLAYDFTHNTKQIYAIGRAVVVEKTTQPSVQIYYYPNIVQHELSGLQEEVEDWFSRDLYYLIQKYEDGTFKTFNLTNIDEATEFESGLENFVDQSKIQNFEFLNDTLLVFLNDPELPVVGINLLKNHVLLENVSAAGTSYDVSITKFSKLGANNKGVKAGIKLNLSL